MKILVCDDMEFNLIAAKQQLEALGHEVITESDAYEALDWFCPSRFNFELVMTDLYFGATPAGLIILLTCIAKPIPVIMVSDSDTHRDELVKLLTWRGIDITNVDLRFATGKYGINEAALCAGFTDEKHVIKDWATALKHSHF